MPPVSERVRALHAQMTLEEKLAQLVGYWVDQGGEVVAPLAGEMATSTRYDDATTHGLGHLTRVYGTRPVDPVERAEWLWAEQRRLKTETRLGIPAIVHEECLTGLAAWKAATFPTPLAWGAAFDPDLVEEMGRLIGGSMRQLGIHQGLAPVLDVIRDPRWGRVDECIAEDPYVVGTIGTAYVRGLQAEGVHATLKHFVGYSASQAGRNHAPVHAGRREINDVFLPPFEMAVLDGGVRSVMNSYAEIDGAPVGATPEYLTGILRDRWGFDGVVVSDYFSVAFLQLMHAVAADRGEAAELALSAGIDVELPTGDAFLAPLMDRVRAGLTDETLIDRAVLRVLTQKEDLGLLDEAFTMAPTEIDLDSPEHRRVARVLAEESLVLLTNQGVLPLRGSAGQGPRSIAVLGPNADSTEALMGCYSFVNHVLAHHPDVPAELSMPTVLESLREEFPGAEIRYAVGCAVEGDDDSLLSAAVDAARQSDVAVVVVGDRAGLFGRGTVGEGNDVESLELPGLQRRLVEAVTATGTPVVMVLMTGRPYAVAWAVDGTDAPAAVLQAFFPGEAGGAAIAAVLSGAVAPTGHLPVSLPRAAGAQPYSYLHPILGGPSDVTSVDSTPVLPFGHGLTYTTFERTAFESDATVEAGGTFTASVRIRNTGENPGTDLVQFYARDVYASVTRPVAQLLGYQRVTLEPGEEAVVRFQVPTARLAFTGLTFERIVEPGEVELWVGPSCAVKETTGSIRITGAVHRVTVEDTRLVATAVEPLAERTRGTEAVPA
ncbi:glycoside hydrolase family 3 N-terminal domain-containing protein [Cryobacterium sp. PAMC25264]|uniref:beta-xylosidase/alpha-l-arabinosidase n=1 Tax=Cryobacterium sp. PAMC25264 TaxID=2861288 RepID=UPI001C629F11|nr:glycoside hydrolase family 3 N-terminal domain-containing protein [Cryobacterium sp. PAMC25264]QYF75585.1 glycoside hydrolase family 3 C-terminal domain-containing protein [Cryobacterium sp. PAMC25264]